MPHESPEVPVGNVVRLILDVAWAADFEISADGLTATRIKEKEEKEEDEEEGGDDGALQYLQSVEVAPVMDSGTAVSLHDVFQRPSRPTRCPVLP